MFGCCGFLSFSSVFCRFGGRLGTTLYIHFIRRWVKARRHSSACREKKNREKAGKSAVLRSAERRALGFADAASAIDATEAGAGAAEVVKGAGRRGVAGRCIRYARDSIREESAGSPCRRKSPRRLSAPPAA